MAPTNFTFLELNSTTTVSELLPVPANAAISKTVSKQPIPPESVNGDQVEELSRSDPSLKVWRLQLLNTGLCLSAFLSTLDSTIVSTSLVSITDTLHGYQKSSWIVTAYLVTYTGFLIIIAKLSDIFGRKTLIQSCLILFIAFSVGCGAAQSLTQLVILRAFQGIGGGGLYTMVFVILPDMVTSEQYPLYATVLSSVFALSNLLGPILGGVISNHTTWRWIFFLNAPTGVIAFILIAFALPRNFPDSRSTYDVCGTSFKQNFRRLDILGALLLLVASVCIVSALEEGGTEYKWTSAVVLALLIVGVILSFIFLLWERHLPLQGKEPEPVFPWRMATDRFVMGNLLNSFFVGSTFFVVVINLPQRSQIVNGFSPFEAGYHLLALTISTPFGSTIAVFLTQKAKVPSLYILLGSAVIQIIGLAIMSTLSTHADKFQPAVYGYEVIIGVGFGLNMGTVVLLAPLVFSKQDMAVGMGAIGQFRALGGSIGLSICTNLLNNHVSSVLSPILSTEELSALLSSTEAVAGISPRLQDKVKEAFASGYNLQWQAMIAFSGGAVLASLMMVEKKPRWQK